MKKIYFLFCVLSAAFISNAQTFPNAGFETWRSNPAGGSTFPPVSPVTIYAPTDWYGFDSIIIAIGTTLPYSLFFSGPLHAQLFQDTVTVHSGSSSAKLITLKQDTLGLVPGILTNALPSINIAAIVAGGSPTSAISYSGGTPVTLRITTVSAWVNYKPGVDSTGAPGQDTGIVVVQAISYIGGKDSVLGTGTALIPPTDSDWIQVTDTIVYADTVDYVDTIRVNFASSGGAAHSLDSSTLNVDDVSMAGVFESTESLHNTAANNFVKIYPNPANTILNIDCPQNAGLNCELYTVSGQVVINQRLSTNNVLDISGLPAGIYFYNINDTKGNTIQRGKVTVSR